MPEENTEPEPVSIKAVPEKTIYLARWSSRFGAWLIDIIFIILFFNIVRGMFLTGSGNCRFSGIMVRWDLIALGFESIFFLCLLDRPGRVTGASQSVKW